MDLYEAREAIEFKKAMRAFHGTRAYQSPLAKSWDETLHPRDEQGRFTYAGGSAFSGGTGDFEVTGDVQDMYLTQSARERISAATARVKTAQDLKNYLNEKGIDMVVDYEPLKGSMEREIDSVKQQADYIIAAVETYEEIGGLSALEAVHIYDPYLDVQAQYSYQATGENTVADRGHLYLSDRCNGFQVMHEFAHAYADSTKPKEMDVVEWSAKLNETAGLSSSATAYFGANQDAIEAEKFADTVGAALCYGDAEKLEFLDRVVDAVRK